MPLVTVGILSSPTTRASTHSSTSDHVHWSRHAHIYKIDSSRIRLMT